MKNEILKRLCHRRRHNHNIRHPSTYLMEQLRMSIEKAIQKLDAVSLQLVTVQASLDTATTQFANITSLTQRLEAAADALTAAVSGAQGTAGTPAAPVDLSQVASKEDVATLTTAIAGVATTVTAVTSQLTEILSDVEEEAPDAEAPAPAAAPTAPGSAA